MSNIDSIFLNYHDWRKLHKRLMSYITRCYKDAFESENREYDPESWSFEYIIIKDKTGIHHLIPFNKCKYGRIQGKVFYRLQRHIDNFNMIIGDNDVLRLSTDVFRSTDTFSIDPNYTEAVFKKKDGKLITLQIFDEDYEKMFKDDNRPRYVDLCCKANNITAEEFNVSPKHLPVEYRHDWNKFVHLFEDTFGYKPGKGYEILCSPGIERLEV